jgi:hypothetical protein
VYTAYVRLGDASGVRSPGRVDMPEVARGSPSPGRWMRERPDGPPHTRAAGQPGNRTTCGSLHNHGWWMGRPAGAGVRGSQVLVSSWERLGVPGVSAAGNAAPRVSRLRVRFPYGPQLCWGVWAGPMARVRTVQQGKRSGVPGVFLPSYERGEARRQRRLCPHESWEAPWVKRSYHPGQRTGSIPVRSTASISVESGLSR